MRRQLARGVGLSAVVAAILVGGWMAAHPVRWVSTLSGGGQAGYADGPVASARWYVPTGLAIDAREAGRPKLYVADTYNHRIRMIDLRAPDGAVVSTIAGRGGLGFSSGSSVDGPAERATFHFPRDLVLDDRGGLYVLDTNGHRVRKIALDAPGRPVTTIAGGTGGYRDGPGAQARFRAPWGMAYDGRGALIVADTYNHVIRRVDLADPAHRVTTIAGGPRGYADGVGQAAAFEAPAGVAVVPPAAPGEATRIYVADASNRCIRLLTPDPAGGPAMRVETVGGEPVQPTEEEWWVTVPLMYPAGIARAPSGDLWVTDQAANTVYRMSPQGALTAMAGDAGAIPGRRDGPTFWARFGQPSGIAAAPDGTLYVADSVNNAVRELR